MNCQRKIVEIIMKNSNVMLWFFVYFNLRIYTSLSKDIYFIMIHFIYTTTSASKTFFKYPNSFVTCIPTKVGILMLRVDNK